MKFANSVEHLGRVIFIHDVNDMVPINVMEVKKFCVTNVVP